ncbi:receptor [Trichosporon asahii var. asahii CBS 2479]|uniref:Receptor n=1 Tax=Trichosporon asahii var. asahii (strain ATCC 90039 / CBS 2479 / JCM 2466 / KCTC 7840 / NBRC 103889/ NCYC 2677 / UAMH 7654) TaxID=1186058 RepID=J6EZW8_TRIAS|nr:receptor [Trichosporon asahii var. asahii CBS 2479]EJT48422.1 receptor [Trichosporon asahii var. asahii CBS 2479]
MPAPTAVNATGLRGHSLLYSVSVFLSIGVWLFGVMSVNQPTAGEIGNMVAILEIGAFITSLCAAYLADKYGRRMTMRIGATLFSIGGVFQTYCAGYTSMVIGRFISGCGVGMLSMIVPIYQAEISPADHRGFLGALEFTGNIVGYSSSVWIDYACSYIQSDWSWRLPLSIQVLGGVILGLGSFVCPESPRYLIDTDQDAMGLQVISDFQGRDIDDPKVQAEYNEIREGVIADRAVGDRSYKALWTRYRSRVLIAMSSQLFAQLNGINVISYYAPLVFEQAGWIGRDAILMTGINSLFYVASSIPPWWLTDAAGRRPILLFGALAMAIALTATGYWIYIDQAITPNAVVVCVVVYNFAFGMSWGPIPWLYPPEIMPLPFRAKGVSLSTATNWLSNYWVGVTTPVFQELIGWRLYIMHAFFCVVSFILVYFLYPETRGVPLEEMDKLFGDEVVEVTETETEDEGFSESETSTLVGHRRPGSILPISRTSTRSASPSPARMGNSLFGRVQDMISGGRKTRRSSLGHYRAIDDGDAEQ